MARPFPDREDDLQKLRVAANTFNKQVQTADRGWSSSVGVEGGVNKFLP
jgi:hypothetical protein